MRVTLTLLVSCLLALPGAASAQDWPRKGLTLVAPFTAGGITDLLTRIMADELGKSLGQPAVVENRGGAGGAVGLNYVLAQPADGYTLAMGGNGPSAIVPSLNPVVNYSPKNFEPIGFVAALPSMLVVHPSVPAKTLLEFAAYAKAQGPKVSCASHGEGSFNHLACVQFNKITGSAMTHVPYKGAAAVKGLILFGLFASAGAIANVDIAEWLYGSPTTGTFWWAAGAAGAIMSAFWNYAMSTLFVWRAR